MTKTSSVKRDPTMRSTPDEIATRMEIARLKEIVMAYEKPITEPPRDVLAVIADDERQVPKLVDLEIALHILPTVNDRLRRLMEIKFVAETLIKEDLKEREGSQRVHGGNVFGLKDGTWSMEPWEAVGLWKFLSTYVGDDITQEQLDAALHWEDIGVTARCPQHGEFAVRAVCRTCGEVARRLMVNHTGINAIEKIGRKDIKEKIRKSRRRGEPSLTVKGRDR